MNQENDSLTTNTILVVDDLVANTEILYEYLSESGFTVIIAQDGEQALTQTQHIRPDLILLDVMMPKLDGFETCRRLKADEATRNIPIIFMTSLSSTAEKVKGFQAGASDYITKPFQLREVLARITVHLTIRNLQRNMREQNRRLQEEITERKRIEVELRRSQEQSDQLLLNILPRAIIQQLKENPGTIAQYFDEVTVLFADIVDFSEISSHMSPTELINFLNDIFSTFDELAERHRLEKIKTIGDEYFVVGGLPTPRPDHAEAIADIALDMQQAIAQFKMQNGESITMRIGINTGPVVAGIIGHKKFSYDLWGNTVNIASRMAFHGVSGSTQVTQTTYEQLRDSYQFIERGEIEVKGKGKMVTYFLNGRKNV